MSSDQTAVNVNELLERLIPLTTELKAALQRMGLRPFEALALMRLVRNATCGTSRNPEQFLADIEGLEYAVDKLVPPQALVPNPAAPKVSGRDG